MRLLPLALASAALVAAVPASASAADAAAAPPATFSTLAFQRLSSPAKNAEVWVKTGTGAAARIAKSGFTPVVSPRGDQVLYSTSPSKGSPSLVAVTVAPAVGPPRVILKRLSYGASSTVWSPDETQVAALTGPEVGKQSLVLLTLATGVRRTVATGYFAGVSFSPDGTQLAYGRTAKEYGAGFQGDVYVAGATEASPAPPVNITKDNKSAYPVWGAQSIAFSRIRKAARKDDAPKSNIDVIQPDGTGRRVVTNVKVPFLLFGLVPSQWSADGSRLLAEYGGQDFSEGYTVDPATGKVRGLGAKQGVLGDGISRDGQTILAETGGYDPESPHNLVTQAYTGGRFTVIVKNAYGGSWNR